MIVKGVKQYYYRLMSRYLAVKIRPRDRAVEVNPQNDYLPHFLKHLKIISFPDEALSLKNLSPDYLVLNGNLHIERDIHSFFTSLRNSLRPATRLIIIYYSSLWKPILMMATGFGMRDRTIETNWITTGDITNFLELSGYEVISDEARVLVPIYISEQTVCPPTHVQCILHGPYHDGKAI